MTKRFCLLQCVKQWRWLAAHPDRTKRQFAAIEDPAFAEYDAYCACCEYSNPNSNGCNTCPLLPFWRKFTDDESTPCYANDSPYAKWWAAVHIRKDKHAAEKEATKIANAAQYELDTLSLNELAETNE